MVSFKFPKLGFGRNGKGQAKSKKDEKAQAKAKAEKQKEDERKRKEQRKKDDRELQQDLSQIYEKEDVFPYKLSGRSDSLKTGIDKLYSLVSEKKSVPLVEAAKAAGAPEDIVVEWARIMEEHHMIRIHYPLFGKPSFRSLDFQPRFAPKKKAKDSKAKPAKEPEKKPKRKGPAFTKKRLFIMAEIVILGQILIYVFFVNQKLSTNFLPTVVASLMLIWVYLSRNVIMALLILAFVGFMAFMIIGRRRMKAKKGAQDVMPKPAKPDKKDKPQAKKKD